MKINFSNHNIVNTAPVRMMFDRPMLERFKVVITKANEAKAETIVFDGHEFVVAYALYLIEYLETKLKP